MTTEEINKAVEEYAKGLNYSMEAKHNMCAEDFEIAFKKGSDFANKHWENKVKQDSTDLNTDIGINDYVNIKLKGKQYGILGQVVSIRFDQYTVLTPFGRMTVPFSILEKNDFIQESINNLLKD